MNRQLQRLQAKRRKLSAALDSLNHKERLLREKIRSLKTVAEWTVKLKTGKNGDLIDAVSAKPQRFAEDLTDTKPSAESYNETYHSHSHPQRTILEVGEKIQLLGNLPDCENRVRVQSNVIFSWSYKKLQ